MLSELRKFRVGMMLSYMYQLDKDISQVVLGNIGTAISFRIGTEDVKRMSEEMFPEFDVQDFINLPNYKIYLKLMIDGRPSRPFSGNTLLFNEIFFSY